MTITKAVIAGPSLIFWPAIHLFGIGDLKMDARIKSGHDAQWP
jgi:hypothetical protein